MYLKLLEQKSGPAKYKMIKYNIDNVLKEMDNLGHTVFTGDKKPFNLNIVGIRNQNAKLDEFGCTMTTFWKFNGEWNFRQWPWTTLPGSTYLQHRLLNRKGCAILVPGQYKSTYALDLHNGKYEALCQRKKTFGRGHRAQPGL